MADSDSDDDVPLAQMAAALAQPAAAAKPAAAAPVAPPTTKPAPSAPEAVKKRTIPDDDEDDDEDETSTKHKVPASNPAKKAKEAGSSNGNGTAKPAAKKRAVADDDSDDSDESSEDSSSEEETPLSSKKKSASGKAKAAVASSSKAAKSKAPPAKKKKAQESSDDSESSSGDEDGTGKSGGGGGEKWYEKGGKVEWQRGGEKWKTLEWNGVLFPPLYQPHNVPFKYDGEVVPLTTDQEEVATMYAAMLNTNYASEPVFQKNFMESWRPLLKQTAEAKHVKDLTKCDFSAIAAHLAELQQAKKDMPAEEKKRLKAEKDKEEEPFLMALVDGRKEKLGNFRVEPPGLFRGRGAHPKMGKLKARIYPEDITLNMSKKARVPPVPDIGDGKKHKWGEIVHKNTVTWLAKWKDSINGEDKCVWLAANSSWKGMSDMAKYEKARELKKHIHRVRTDYSEGMKSKDIDAQQRSVAVYLIDRLALRVGGEKDTGEEADTVGCCSLRVEHVKLDAGENMLHLNFLGKDSIEYDNTNEIKPEVYQLILKFMKNKKPEDQLFDRVQPADLNEYFHSVMDGLSAKVFRTYNASITLCSELQKTDVMVTAEQRRRETDVVALCNYYTLANKTVAILCNHQKAASANHAEQMAKMDAQIDALKKELKEAKKAKLPKAENLQKRLDKAEAARRTKDETKCVSLGTSKINYNDPRITIAWCKAHEVPIQKQFPKTLLAKFAWAMNVEPSFRF